MVGVNNVSSAALNAAALSAYGRNNNSASKSTDISTSKTLPEDNLAELKQANENPFEQKIDSLLQAQEEASKTESSALNSELTPEEEQQVQELKQTDREVRAHEAAHKTVGGPYAGAVTFETTTGPDGREYAIAGEVQIDASPIPNNPEATIRKMDVVIRAALAPAEPSSQDKAVAAQAQQTRIQARQEAAKLRQEEQEAQNNGNFSPNSVKNTSATVENTILSNVQGNNQADEIVYILFGNNSN